jgi:NADH-quinone oxidoreductase subunit N
MNPFSLAGISQSLNIVLPEMIVIGTALVVLLADLFLPEDNKRPLAFLGTAGTLLALFATVSLGYGSHEYGFSGMVANDGLAWFTNVSILCATAMVLLMSTSYGEWEGTQKGEFHSLILLSASGMMLMARGTDLMTVFLGLETLSIPIYVLVGFHRNRFRSIEGSLKYFLLGAFGAAFFLYGTALLYAAVGSTKIPTIATAACDTARCTSPLFLAGVGFLLVGLAFKVSLAPFHMWTPDAYEGAPSLVTAFMSAAVKAAAFAVLLRVLFFLLPSMSDVLVPVLWVLTVLTMTVGNLSALLQDNLKRMLAYSSIAHAGYVMVGVLSGDVLGAQAALFYLFVYAFMNIGAFGVFMVIADREDEGYHIESVSGIGFRYPVLGALGTLFLVSLAGIPPTAGFIGKFYLFSAAVKNGYFWLAILGVLNSAASIYYYLRVVVYMYFRPAAAEASMPRPPRMAYSVALCSAAAVILVLGIMPRDLLAAAERSVLSLLM